MTLLAQSDRLRVARKYAWRIGRRLYCDARGEPNPNSITTNGESYVQRCVLSAAKSTGSLCVFDVGANQGEWTASFLKNVAALPWALSVLELHVFEPVPATVERLSQTLAKTMNGRLANVHNLALSDEAGGAAIALMSEKGGTNTLHPGIESPLANLAVERQTMVEFVQKHQLSRIHLTKSDTEGHDLFVLQGARQLFVEERIDVFQFEYNHRWVYSRSFLKDVFDLIEGLPYLVARILPASIEILPSWHPELERFFEANYMIVSAEAVHWFDARRGAFSKQNTYE